MSCTVTGDQQTFCLKQKNTEVCTTSEQTTKVCTTAERETFIVKDKPKEVGIEPRSVIAPLTFIKRIIDTRINIADNCTLLMRNTIFTANGQIVVDIEGEALML